MLDLNQIKDLLTEKLAKLQDRASRIENTLSEPKSADSEERATELEDVQSITTLGHVVDHEIRDIKIAIDRIDAGTYSTCSVCGKAISVERLKALPWTNRCIRCAYSE